jgi:multiple sugar transport system ATP-binding protein
MMSGVSLHLDRIEKSYGPTRVLDGIDLKAQAGEFIALVGPSGCGKSTLLRIAAGLDHPDHGRVILNGQDVTHQRAADRDMAMVFQSYALYPHLTARQNMSLPLAMRRLSVWERLPLIGRLGSETRDRYRSIQTEVEQAAATLKISPLLDRKPGQMSGGQRQRVALGRALVRHPKTFLMDEPLSNLDAALRVHTRAEIVELHKRAGVVTLYVTHDQEEALSMADRVAVMIGGRIMQCDTPAKVYDDPSHLDVACFIGSPRINLIGIKTTAAGRGYWRDHLFISDTGCGFDVSLTAGVRPEDLILSTDKSGLSMPVTLFRTEFLGSEALVHVRLAGEELPLITRTTPQNALAFEDAKTLYVSAAPEKILLFDTTGSRVRHGGMSRPLHAHHAA